MPLLISHSRCHDIDDYEATMLFRTHRLKILSVLRGGLSTQLRRPVTTRSQMAGNLPLPEVTARHTFRYTPLDGTNSIRILTLHPGENGSPLRGQLTTEDLASAPKYECISYVWGSGRRRVEMFIGSSSGEDGEEQQPILALTQSVHDALSRLRLPDRPRRLWADQVCINQADVAERSRQVSLMNAIYKGAEHILVWLGRDFDGVAHDAVRMINHLSRVFANDDARVEFRRQHSEELLHQSEEPWVPLSKLTKQPWVRRGLPT